MNSLTTTPDAARTIARHTIAERVRDAEERRTVRTARAEQRDACERERSHRHHRPHLTLRFLHPAV